MLSDAEEAAEQEEERAATDCQKANTGLFMGLFIMVITMIAVSSFFVFSDKDDDYKTEAYIFYITEIVLGGIAGITVLLGFLRMRKLKFSVMEDGWLDVVLLLVALFGTFVHAAFNILSSANSISEQGTMAVLACGASLILFVQALMQTAFILDGLRRRADSHDHVHHKPGRTLVTFLLLVNLAMWVVMVFEVKKADATPMHEDFYGALSWAIISHVCLPLIIFYRFHSSVCLSDIWVHAYHKDKNH